MTDDFLKILNRGDRFSGTTHGQAWNGTVTHFGVERRTRQPFAIVKLDEPIQDPLNTTVPEIAVPLKPNGTVKK